MQVNIKFFSFLLFNYRLACDEKCLHVFHNLRRVRLFVSSGHNLHTLASSVFWFRGIDGLGEDYSGRFRSPKNVEEYELLAHSKPRSAQYGKKLVVKVLKNCCATRELIYFQSHVIG